MRVFGVAVLSLFVAVACGGGGTPTAAHSPISTPATSSAPTASTSAIPTGSPGPASLVHCPGPVPAGDNLVIGTVVGDPTIVVRDIQDPANAKNVCTLDAGALAPQFVSASTVAYETAENQIVEAPVAGGPTTLIATYSSGFGSGQYAVSPDGRSVTYLDGNAWRVVSSSGNRVLSTLPASPNRGVAFNQDDSFLAFSPDGLYVALFQTFHVGGSGETAPDQVRKASDGQLVYSTTGMTMAVWASVPSRLFFRDNSGNLHRWDPSSGLSAMTSLGWVRPKASPDGRCGRRASITPTAPVMGSAASSRSTKGRSASRRSAARRRAAPSR